MVEKTAPNCSTSHLAGRTANAIVTPPRSLAMIAAMLRRCQPKQLGTSRFKVPRCAGIESTREVAVQLVGDDRDDRDDTNHRPETTKGCSLLAPL